MQEQRYSTAHLPGAAEAFTRPFYFLRHGETLYNRERRIQGQSDVPLSPLGLEQAEQASLELSGAAIDRIVSSALYRATQTADVVAARLGLAVEREAGLMETHFGIYQDQLYQSWDAGTTGRAISLQRAESTSCSFAIGSGLLWRGSLRLNLRP